VDLFVAVAVFQILLRLSGKRARKSSSNYYYYYINKLRNKLHFSKLFRKRSITRSPDTRIKKEKRKDVERESMEKVSKKRKPSPSPAKKVSD